ncbi:MAG: DEAD/DEAH box helicase [Gemmatimonadaceae bacterium]|nr:DEAD/DEAH box helicase [Gemmatimonadaceae bacterium]
MTKRTSSTPEAGFATLGLDPRLLDALAALGYEEPTPIQQAAIPPLRAGRDVLAMAATGTGKTAAFALPLLHRIDPSLPPKQRLRALVLVPTRELAMQVAEAIHRYGKTFGASALPIYGGASMEQQISRLKRGVDVVIATPGRALDHIRRKTLALAGVQVVVLDEADEMLDMGFAEDLEAILSELPPERQTALFSATLPARIATIARTHLRDPEVVKIERPATAPGETAKVRQVAYVVARAHKMAALARVLDVEAPESAIVFCRTRTEVDQLTETLMARGYRAEALHGGLSQDQRDRVMKRFRAKGSDLLIATDVAARGLDVKHVTHVVNFDVPWESESYVHRIGRTGRAGRDGVAITFAEPREHRLLRNIETATGQKIEIGTVPTAADLRSRQLEQLRDQVLRLLADDELDRYRPVIERLAEEHDIMDVAAAALRLAARREDGESEPEDIPSVQPRGARDGAAPRPARQSRREFAGKVGGTVAKIYIGAGRKLKIRPGDIVGAIAGEANIPIAQIGAVQIGDRHSIVEVPEDKVGLIIAKLSASTIKGKKVRVRRDQA